MTIQETAQQLRQEFFKQAEQEAINNCNEKEQLKEKINKLEKMIEDLSKRLDYLENNLCH